VKVVVQVILVGFVQTVAAVRIHGMYVQTAAVKLLDPLDVIILTAVIPAVLCAGVAVLHMVLTTLCQVQLALDSEHNIA
jgi:hypothetical protein